MRRGGRDGFTLVEVLAAVTLLGLVASALTVRLAATSEAAAFRALEARLVDMDERARLFARAGEPVVLSAPADAGHVELRVRESGDVLARVALGDGTAFALRTTAPAEAIVYDRRGVTVDHSAALRRDDRRARWSVAGATGWIARLDDDEEASE